MTSQPLPESPEREIQSLSPEQRRREARDLRGRIELQVGPGTRAWEVAKRTLVGTYNDGFIHAGNLAYLSMLAIFPFFILGAAVFSAFGEEAERAATINAVLYALPPIVGNVIEPVARDVIEARSGWLLWAGAGVALWTVGSLVETIRDILRRAYGTHATHAFWKYRLLSTGVILSAVLLLLLSLIAQFVIGAAQEVIAAYFPQLVDGVGDLLRLTRIVPALGLFGSLYLIFYSLTPSKYRRKRYPKWPGVLLTTLWWIAVTTVMPAVLRNFFAYDLTYGGLAGVMIVLFFFWLVGLGVVIGAELNAALAETPEEEFSQTEETDEGRRAALAREMEEEEHAA
ncbi:MAG: YihY/virulence factor BrkB family protein [Pseudomonadota bacterium]|mgnify:FL=1|uniref:YihY/virulence factor BrkB family protein n=1 Tax=Qipengyuania flava TaxID=192812 RepID=UPI000AD2181D|nr:YihY/virulence factor BrkB family protein [Qipengyuania flava]MEC7623965.1 YihY/virulence factor BrkB family protein [Pseudomonadota bacterium]MEC7742788.1 YihY/virulence factor BrkB family protein [Pseudomonadota bacterium]MEC8713937.1 YihY/virulence factor BrkB family protein [Pseudomonadota bacterium]MEC9110004.1 YihY/virulence factor BrkB family protein [Pseudomonadota bacterium]UOR09078.1 YihY/virulence factor BrkB family protein [Qipengyuania flava]